MKIAVITGGLTELIKFLKRWKSLFCQTPSQLLKPKKRAKNVLFGKVAGNSHGNFQLRGLSENVEEGKLVGLVPRQKLP